MAKSIARLSGRLLAPGRSLNCRLYPPPLLARACERMNARIVSGGLPLAILTSHGAAGADDSTRLIGQITAAWIDPSDGSIMFEAALADVPLARSMLNLLDPTDTAPYVKGISIRGHWLGPVREVDDDGVTCTTGDELVIDGADITLTPGSPTAGVSAVVRAAIESVTAESADTTPIFESAPAVRVEVVTETAPDSESAGEEPLAEALLAEPSVAGADVDDSGELTVNLRCGDLHVAVSACRIGRSEVDTLCRQAMAAALSALHSICDDGDGGDGDGDGDGDAWDDLDADSVDAGPDDPSGPVDPDAVRWMMPDPVESAPPASRLDWSRVQIDESGHVLVWDVEEARYVRTEAGSRRYGLPVKSLIVSKREKRDAKMAKIVKAHRAALAKAQAKYGTGPHAKPDGTGGGHAKAPETPTGPDRSGPDATFTADEIKAIGGKEWVGKNGTTRLYLNDWPGMVGYDGSSLDGVSNSKAGKLLAARVYWQDGQIHSDVGSQADAVGVGIPGDELDARLRRSIADRVGQNAAAPPAPPAPRFPAAPTPGELALKQLYSAGAEDPDNPAGKLDTDTLRLIDAHLTQQNTDRGRTALSGSHQNVRDELTRRAGGVPAVSGSEANRDLRGRSHEVGLDQAVRDTPTDALQAIDAQLTQNSVDVGDPSRVTDWHQTVKDELGRRAAGPPPPPAAPANAVETPAALADRILGQRPTVKDPTNGPAVAASALDTDDLRVLGGELNRRIAAGDTPFAVKKLAGEITAELAVRAKPKVPLDGAALAAQDRGTRIANRLVLSSDPASDVTAMSMRDLRDADIEFQARAMSFGAMGKPRGEHLLVRNELRRRTDDDPAPPTPARGGPAIVAALRASGDPVTDAQTLTLDDLAAADSEFVRQAAAVGTPARPSVLQRFIRAELVRRGGTPAGPAESAVVLDLRAAVEAFRLGADGVAEADGALWLWDPAVADYTPRCAEAAAAEVDILEWAPTADRDRGVAETRDRDPLAVAGCGLPEGTFVAFHPRRPAPEPLDTSPAAPAAVTPTHPLEAVMADEPTDTDITELVEAAHKLSPEFLANIAKKKAQAKSGDDGADTDDEDDDADDADDADKPPFLKKKTTKESTVPETVTESREDRIERLARERAAAVRAQELEESEIDARAAAIAEAARAEETAVEKRVAEIAAAAAAEKQAAALANESIEQRVERRAQEMARTLVQQHIEQNGPPARTGLTAAPGNAVAAATESTSASTSASDWPEKPMREYTEAEREAIVLPALERHFMGSRSVFAE